MKRLMTKVLVSGLALTLAGSALAQGWGSSQGKRDDDREHEKVPSPSPALPGTPGKAAPRVYERPWVQPPPVVARGHERWVEAERPRYKAPKYTPPRGYYVRQWAQGDKLPPGWAAGRYRIAPYSTYRLPTPGKGQVWVQVGHDALLVDLSRLRVMDVIPNLFW